MLSTKGMVASSFLSRCFKSVLLQQRVGLKAKDGVLIFVLGVALLIACVFLVLPPDIQRLAFASTVLCAAGASLVIADVKSRGLVHFLSPHARKLLTEE